MSDNVRVLYSFPHKLGADRICHTAWQQVNGIAAAGADVLVFPGVLHKPVHAKVNVHPTLSYGKIRVSYKLMGRMAACMLHDIIVTGRLRRLAGNIDIIHTWPLGALQTLKMAAKLGIPTALERPNSHTRFAYGVVQRECERLGVALPARNEHAFNARYLRREEQEYRWAYRLLCPSDFVVRTFVEQGFARDRLVRHTYGFDGSRFYPEPMRRPSNRGLTMISVGVCAVRKGLHFALEAWLSSPVHRDGLFLIVGEFVPAYEKKLLGLLAHSSVKVLGHRTDVPELMRKSDILVLPSIEEGFPLVCAEAMGSGCVPLVSDVCAGICRHMENALVHRVGDVRSLTDHMTLLHQDRALLDKLRTGALKTAPDITWAVAGQKLVQVYRAVIADHAGGGVSEEADEGRLRQVR